MAGGDFSVEVPIGARDDLTPVLDRAERRMRRFNSFMRGQLRQLDRTYARSSLVGLNPDTAAGRGGYIPGQAGTSRGSHVARRTGGTAIGGGAGSLSPRFRGMTRTTGLMPMGFGAGGANPAAISSMQRGFNLMRNNLRSIAPLAQRAFAPMVAAGAVMGPRMQQAMSSIPRALSAARSAPAASRAGAAARFTGRAVGGVARGAAAVGGGAMGMLSPHNLFTGLALGYAAKNALTMGVGGPLQLAGQMEQATITFETLTGSVAGATKMMQFLYDFAERTPLEFGPVREWGQSLLQWGFAAERIPKLMEAVASAASVMPDPEQAGGGITRALGQMRLRGRVLMEEINQLQDQGVPALEMLSKAYGVSTQELIKWMETGARPAALVGKQLRGGIDIITEGIMGRYPGMLEKQSKTLLGMFSTLKDIIRMRFILPWGEGLQAGIQPILADTLKWFDENKESVTEIGNVIRDIGKSLGAWAGQGLQAMATTIKNLFGSEEWKSAQTFGDKIGLLAGKVGEVLWGSGEGNKGLVQGVMDWVKDQSKGIMEWGQARWTDFSNMVGEKIQTWTTWTAERINEFKAEALKKFNEIVEYFKTTFQDTIVNAIKAVIPWFKDPRGGGSPGGPGGATAAGAPGSTFEGLGTSALPGGGVAIAAGSSALTVPQTQAFLRQYGFDEKTIASACGPIAAAGLARAFGIAVSPEEMIRNAPQFGWKAGPGMGGYQNFRKMVGSMGLETSVISQEEAVAAMARGEPITMSTPQHYFLGQGIDPTKGIHVGNTGAMFGSEYMSLNDIARHGRGRPTYIRTTRPGGAPISAPAGASAATIGAAAAGGGGSGFTHVEVGEVTVVTSPHEDPAAVNQAVADGFASALAGSLEGAFGNMPHVTR